MLNKPCFVTKSVVTILPHAMEVGLMLTVIAASESAVFIEPIEMKKKRYVSLYAILFKIIRIRQISLIREQFKKIWYQNR